MGTFLQLVGIGWALIGVANFYLLATKIPPPSDTMLGFSLLFQGILFVLPGLSLAGKGHSIASKHKPAEVPSVNTRPEPMAPATEDVKKCPFCAETIKKEAIICRFCNREVSSGQPDSIRTYILK